MKIKDILFLFLIVNSLQEEYKEIDLNEGKPVNINADDINKADIYFFIKASKDQYINLKFIGHGNMDNFNVDYDELSSRSLDSKVMMFGKNGITQSTTYQNSNFIVSNVYQVSSPKANYVYFKLKKMSLSITNIIVEYYIQEDNKSNIGIFTNISNTEEITFKANNKYSYYVTAKKPQKVYVNMKMKYKNNKNPFSHQFFDYSNINYSDSSSKCTNEVKDNILSETCTFTVCSESVGLSSFIFVPNIDLEVNSIEIFTKNDSKDSGSGGSSESKGSEGGKNATNANESSSAGVTVFIVILILIIIGVVAFFVIKKYRTPKNNEITSPLTPADI
jgi:hypothetical protein